MEDPIITGDADEAIWTFDQLLQARAIEPVQAPLLAYPRSRTSATDYETIDGKQLSRLIEGACATLESQGLKSLFALSTGSQEDASASQPPATAVIGVLGKSDLEYIIAVFALGRLGYTPFLISPRLAPNAIDALLERTKAVGLLYQREQKIPQILQKHEKQIPIPARHEYMEPTGKVGRYVGATFEHQSRPYIILHSSGSTGIPKPIDYTNRRFLSACLVARDAVCFQTVPISHAHGLVTVVHAIYMRKTIFLMNAHIPQTCDTITAAIVAAKPEVVYTVPYVLKLLAEKPAGIAALKAATLVSASGSRTPDELGDLLTAEGVHFGTVFGSTETAMIFNSTNRPRGDKAWNYLRPPPHVKPFLWMRPVDGDPVVCEAVVLDGHSGKTVSNSNDPPNSWYTNDLFVAHPTIPDAWKFIGRKDDRITLINGEKVLPLPIEGRIRQHPLVREAVMFGVDRDVPGLLLFRTTESMTMTPEQYLEKVWPVVEAANEEAEGFSKISQDLIVLVDDQTECPLTDKSSVKRAQVYRDFSVVIEAAYQKLEQAHQQAGVLQDLAKEELVAWLMASLASIGAHPENPHTDLFSAGVDSWQAILLRSLILKNINLGGHRNRCTPMIVYECGTAEALADMLIHIRAGEQTDQNAQGSRVDEMEGLVRRYSQLDPSLLTGASNGEGSLSNELVLLTGATGFLGSHILAQIVESCPKTTTYCLLRQEAPSEEGKCLTAKDRLILALKRNGHGFALDKVQAIYADLEDPQLGMSPPMYSSLQREATHIIHCAWPVNFALSLNTFEPALRSLRNLLQLAVGGAKTVNFSFCSSIAAALGASSSNSLPALIESAQLPSFLYAANTGYGQSKLVAENIVCSVAASHNLNCNVFRIGQILPGRKRGLRLWKPTEATPLMIRSAILLKVLPLMPEAGGLNDCRWVEVDDLAAAILTLGNVYKKDPKQSLDIAQYPRGRCSFYNLVNPNSVSWNSEFLPALQRAGLEFDAVPYADWLERLKGSVDDAQLNPTKKLLSFFESRQVAPVAHVRFDTSAAENKSSEVKRWKRIVDEDGVSSLVSAWMESWGVAPSTDTDLSPGLALDRVALE